MAKDLEKENKKLKKQAKANGKVAIILLLLLLIIAAIFLLFKPFGFGLGLLGDGFGGNSSGTGNTPAATSAPEAATTTAAQAAETVSYIDVTIKDASYILDGNEVSADDIVKMATERDMNTIVRLHNDNGIIDAYDKLAKALEQGGITYEKDSSFDVE